MAARLLPRSSSSKRQQFSFAVLLLLFQTLCCHAAAVGNSQQEGDRVRFLPGQPPRPPVSQFAGYVTVNERNGRALFYWFFEAHESPAKKPLLLWLNGGPGCSSVGYGAASELGPLRVTSYGAGLKFNKFAWNREANLLFLESPVGVGFSYTNTSSDLTKLDDTFVAEDAYNFLVNWFKRFPQYKGREFYISGESYAGHYVPQLAELVHDRNKDKASPYINLKGFMVGNPLTDDYYDSKGLAEYAWSHAVVSDEIYERIKKVCDFKISNWSDDCDKAMSTVFSQYHEIDIYNIYAPRCNLPQSSAALAVDQALTANDQEHFRRRIRMFSGYDPCYSSYAERYFNKEDVQRAFHANVSGTRKWQVCSDSILRSYNFSVLSILPIYSKLIKAGLRVWLYSGDADGRVPVIGSRYCVEALGLPIKTKWQPWYLNKQVAGRFVEYHGMTMVTIRGAGHLVPLNKPEEGLALIDTFLLGKQLPTHR
ncbi:serine carboxypeptidase-like 33 isoform X1 [Panicum miliaceum]|uniref:Carboxypeptidase n=1 Tax=Panicum miliaceum TaxID=4540 RepID=A0A3L6R429_PANMI|nr:serine carboxypeptidase-like 33 isoform X1 [Panicum miliaceum]